MIVGSQSRSRHWGLRVDKGWQQFVNHIAQRQDERQRKQDMVGTILWAIIAGMLALACLCIILKAGGWWL